MLTLGSLFDGIGGFCLAGQMCGIKPIWSSEIEPFPLKVTEARFPDVKQLGSVTDINGADIEPVDIITFGSPCFPAGTLVNTDVGYKPIEDVRVTDKVLTHNGIYRQVLDSRYTGTKTVMRLKAMGVHAIEATPNHLFLIRRDRNQGIAEWKRLDELKKGYLLAVPIIQTEENPLSLTDEECWLIGRYIADGYVRIGQRPDRPNGSEYASVVFCVGKGKEDVFESRLMHYKAGKSTLEGNVFKYTISSHRLTQICEACGIHAINKHLPTFVLNLPKNLLKTVIDGYMSGDGCTIDGLFKATSISERLVYSLGQAVLKAYRVPYRIYKNEVQSTTTIQGRVVNQHAQWQLVFKTDVRKRDNAFCEGEYAWLPVRKIEIINERKAVYDLTVEQDHSFCVMNVAVHNCQDLSVAGKQLGIHEGQRSNLFFEAIRIIKEMRQADEARGRSGKSIRPRFAVWENVPGTYSSNKGRDFQSVLQALCEIGGATSDVPMPKKGRWEHNGCIVGDGYSVAWKTLDAQYSGVPQRRKRIYLVADFGSERAGEILLVKSGVSGHFTESRETREGTSADVEGSIGGSGGVRCYALKGNYIDRDTKQNGIGWRDGEMYTLDATDRHGVCYPEIARSLCARADSSPCVDRGQNIVCYGVDCRNAVLDEEKTHTLQAKANGGISLNCTPSVCYRNGGYGDMVEGIGTLRANGGDAGYGSENIVVEKYE